MSKQRLSMKNLYPNGTTKFCFLIGTELKNSPSPSLHTTWFQGLNFNSIYLPCQIQEENTFIDTINLFLKIDNFIGANITMPFKNSILKVQNIEHTIPVILTGSANTLYKNQNNNWCLENTDLFGIKKTIESLIPGNTNYNLIILGGGGAASSCIYYAEQDTLCRKIFCFTRSPNKTYAKFPILRRSNKLQIFELDLKILNEIIKLSIQEDANQIIVNTMPLLNTENNFKNNFPIQLLKGLPINKTYYFDMIYRNTESLKFAQAHSIKCSDGMMMLEEQAKQSFFLWTGVYPK